MNTHGGKDPGAVGIKFRFLYGRWILSNRGSFARNSKFRFLYGRWIHCTCRNNWYHLFKFRFLYGRWILLKCLNGRTAMYGSDSSMVDEYPAWEIAGVNLSTFRFLYGRWIQRPAPRRKVSWLCSDSSMVDEYHWGPSYWLLLNHVQIPLWSMNTHANGWSCYYLGVQIPLWSMNTQFGKFLNDLPQAFRFLYGRWIHAVCSAFKYLLGFRFLYGRWIRGLAGKDGGGYVGFRFLYGRWIQQCKLRRKECMSKFRFLYGRWILTSLAKKKPGLF